MSSNIVIGLPSGQILNCDTDCKYILYNLGLANYFSYYEGDILGEYGYLDKNYTKVKKIVKNSYKIGTKVHHIKYGRGKIGGIFGDNGWIIHFINEEEKKMYVDDSMLMQDLRFKIL